MKIRIALLFLTGVFLFTSNWQVISPALRINFAYVFLTRAIKNSDQSAATRFIEWAGQSKSSTREQDASAYGLAMLLASQASNLPKDWLQGWNKVGCHLTTGPYWNEITEWKVVESILPKNLLAMTNCLDDQTSAQLLISAAERRPNDATVYVKGIERRGLVTGLSQANLIRLAAVYGSLADQIRRSGSSTGEVLAMVDKSLALDPQSELALINKALMLGYSGQLLDGIALLEQITVLYPKSTFAWECLAALRINNSDYQRAESAARTSILLIPSDSRSWGKYLLAVALLSQGRCSEALYYAQLTARDAPKYPNYLLTLGDVYWCLGERQQASSVYQQLEALHPDYASYVHERILSTK